MKLNEDMTMKTELEVLLVHDDPRHGFRYSRGPRPACDQEPCSTAPMVRLIPRPLVKLLLLPSPCRSISPLTEPVARPIETGWEN